MDWMVRVPSKGSIAAGVSSVVNIVWAMGGRPGVGVAAGCNGIGSLPQLSRNLEDGSSERRERTASLSIQHFSIDAFMKSGLCHS